MVDFTPQKSYLYVPRNLSHDEYFSNHYVPSLLFEALHLNDDSLIEQEAVHQGDTATWIIKNSHCDVSSSGLRALDLANPSINLAKAKLDIGDIRRYPKLASISSGSFDTNCTKTSDLDSECFPEDSPTESISADLFSGQMNRACSSWLETADSPTENLDRVTLNFPHDNSTADTGASSTKTIDDAAALLDDDDDSVFCEILPGRNGEKGDELSKNSENTDVSPTATRENFTPDSEFDFLQQKVKRSSSLKTSKTPPGTPDRKKVVRFADALGLDLEDIRTVMNSQDPPHIPASAMRDLKVR